MSTWQQNPQPDPDLSFDYCLDKWIQKVFYLQDSWLPSHAKILVTGTSGWLGHYLLYMLTEYKNTFQILCVDSTSRPSYLNLPRYASSQYIELNAISDIRDVIESFSPQIIFHADYIWNISEKKLSRIYEVNVCYLDILCDAAIKANVKRVVVFSDFTVYGIGLEESTEDAPLVPVTQLSKSFIEADHIAESYYKLEKTGIYTLRLAPLYGPLISTGVMVIGKLIAEGILLGPPDQSNNRNISILSGYDMALAALLLATAPNPGYRTFNVSGETLPFVKLLKDISDFLPMSKVMGFQTRLAHIMKIGYQENISLPDSFLKFIGRFSEQSCNFLNQLRVEKKEPVFTPKILEYISQFRCISNKRIRDALGWEPETSCNSLNKALTYARKLNWHRSQQVSVPHFMDKIEVLDGVTEMVQSVVDYVPYQEQACNFVKVPLFGFEMDIKSLWILTERAWSFLWLSLFKGESSGSLIHKIFPEIFSLAGESILDLIRYEQIKAKRLFPESHPDRIQWLTKQIGSLNRKKVQFYATIAILSEIIVMAHKKLIGYVPLLSLLPEKNYGVYCMSDIGDIGITLQFEKGRTVVSFPRKEVDSILHTYSFSKRVSEFQKMTHSHIVLGIKLECLLEDLMSGKMAVRFLEKLGNGYLVSDSSDYYRLIGKAVKKSNINTYIFMDSPNQIIFGIRLKGQKLEMLSPSYLEMVDNLLKHVEDYKEVIQLLSASSQGKEQVAFFRIHTIRRLLGGMIAPSRIRKFIVKLIQRAGGI